MRKPTAKKSPPAPAEAERFTPTEENRVKREAILQALSTLQFGESMTFEALSTAVGVVAEGCTDPQFAWARNKAIDKHVVLEIIRGEHAFRRMTRMEMALSEKRLKRIRNSGRKGQREVQGALFSNNPRDIALASVASTHFHMAAAVKPASNREIPSDKLEPK